MNIYSNRRTLLKSGVLGRDILMDEFERNLLQTQPMFLENLIIRSEIMRRAASFVDFSKLRLDDSDSDFLKNNRLLIKFFQEILVENVDLDKLQEYKAYKDYSAHIEILKQILVNYITIMHSESMDDLITVANKFWSSRKVPDSNLSWLKNVDKIDVFYDGILSRLDLELLSIVGQKFKKDKKEINLYIHTDSWFEKSILRLEKFNSSFEADKIYKIDLRNNKTEIVSDFTPSFNIEVNPVIMSSMYGPYITHKVSELIKENNVKPSEIGIVCVNEDIQKDLQLFMDKERLFFHKTQPLSGYSSIKILNLILELKKEELVDDFKLNRKTHSILKALFRYISMQKIQYSDIIHILENLKTSNEFDFINNLIVYMYEMTDVEEEKNMLIQLQESLLFHSNILKTMTLEELLNVVIWMSNDIYEELYTDDENIEVITFMESRGFSKRFLFILGFQENLVPMSIKKDRFIDSSLRAEVGMPNYSDRISMQYHYWQSLITKSEKTFISYKTSDGSNIAPVIKTFGDHTVKHIDKDILLSYMFENNNEIHFDGLKDEICVPVKEKRTLSASKLRTYLTCKRKYYYKYIKNIPEPILNDISNENREIGIILHRIIEKSVDNIQKMSLNELKEYAKNLLFNSLPRTNTFEYNFKYWSEKLDNYLELEYEEAALGNQVIAHEKRLEAEYKGVILYGVLDRIDLAVNNRIVVADYKTGKTPALRVTGKGEVDFQPEMYKILAKHNFTNNDGIDFIYKNLKTCDITPVIESDKRNQAFFEALDSFVDDDGCYNQTETVSNCNFCPFRDMCNR